MFPLRDRNPTELTPWITLLLVAANIAVWVLVQGAGMDQDVLAQSVCRYGTIPAELMGGGGGPVRLTDRVSCGPGGLTWSTVLTSMFLHGGWMHLIGNLWFLWIFGNNVEDSMGHLRFLAFYLLTGVAASAAHVFSAAGSGVPTIGASGAISGIMGAYLVLYPRIRVDTLFVLFIYVRVFSVPAWLILLEWFAIQLFQGFYAPADGAGVAFWAHIGGFVAGLLLVKLFENRQLVGAKKAHLKLDPRQIPHRGWW